MASESVNRHGSCSEQIGALARPQCALNDPKRIGVCEGKDIEMFIPFLRWKIYVDLDFDDVEWSFGIQIIHKLRVTDNG